MHTSDSTKQVQKNDAASYGSTRTLNPCISRQTPKFHLRMGQEDWCYSWEADQAQVHGMTDVWTVYYDLTSISKRRVLENETKFSVLLLIFFCLNFCLFEH